MVWANPSLQYVSSSLLSCSSSFFFAHPAWPCNSAWTIRHRLLQLLFLCSYAFPPVPPTVFVRNTVSAPEERGRMRVGEDAEGCLKKIWQGQSWGLWLAPFNQLLLFRPYPVSHPPLYHLHSLFTHIFYHSPCLLLSRPPWHSSHPLLRQMLLLSFTLFSCPPPIGDIIIFRHRVAMFVCVWLPDADLISKSSPCQLHSRHHFQEWPLTGK